MEVMEIDVGTVALVIAGLTVAVSITISHQKVVTTLARIAGASDKHTEMLAEILKMHERGQLERERAALEHSRQMEKLDVIHEDLRGLKNAV